MDVQRVLGDFPVQVREYARGAEARAEVKRLEEPVAYYMMELEPGGRFSRKTFREVWETGGTDAYRTSMPIPSSEPR